MKDLKLIIPFEGKTEAAIDGGGEVTFIGFERIKRIIEEIELESFEKCTGLIITKDGVTVKIERK